MCRRFLVWPASLIWPQNLVACTLLNTLHAEDEEGSTGMTRYRFFVIATGCAAVWTFFPCECLGLGLDVVGELVTYGLGIL